MVSRISYIFIWLDSFFVLRYRNSFLRVSISFFRVLKGKFKFSWFLVRPPIVDLSQQLEFDDGHYLHVFVCRNPINNRDICGAHIVRYTKTTFRSINSRVFHVAGESEVVNTYVVERFRDSIEHQLIFCLKCDQVLGFGYQDQYFLHAVLDKIVLLPPFDYECDYEVID